jgi:hypothetical protein
MGTVGKQGDRSQESGVRITRRKRSQESGVRINSLAAVEAAVFMLTPWRPSSDSFFAGGKESGVRSQNDFLAAVDAAVFMLTPWRPSSDSFFAGGKESGVRSQNDFLAAVDAAVFMLTPDFCRDFRAAARRSGERRSQESE